MKKFVKQTALLVAVIMLTALVPTSVFAEIQLMEAVEPTVFYVAPDGDDTAAGDEAAPLATLNGARDKIRALKEAQGGVPYGGATVYVKGGTYTVTEPFYLDEQDSGEENAPVVYRAYGDEAPVFSGGITLEASGFTVMENENIAAYDLSAVEDLGVLPYSGMTETGAYTAELFSDGEPMTIAQYPNEGFIDLTDGSYVNDESSYTVTIPEEKTALWKAESDPRVSGYWSTNYNISDYKITVNDDNTITTNAKGSDIADGQCYYAYNMLCELDTEGEYYIDRENKKLYVYKGADFGTSVLTLSTYIGNFIENGNSTDSIAGASYVTLDGLTFEYGRGDGFKMNTSAQNVIINNCTFQNLAGQGIFVRGGNNIISNNTVKNVNKGINVSAGDLSALELCGTEITGNTISNFARISKMYTPGINLWGCGIVVRNNELFNSPHCAIAFGGNEHIIENNDIHDVLLATSDAGAIYAHIGTAGDALKGYSQRGTKIRNNYFHHLGTNAQLTSYDFKADGGYRYGVYMDAFCGTEISENVFYKVEHGVNINSGRDNTVKNNIFLENEIPVRFTGLGANKAPVEDINELMWYSYYQSDAVKALYETKYPEMLTVTTENYGMPSGNVIESNIHDGNAVTNANGDPVYFAFQGLDTYTEENAQADNTISAPFISETVSEASFNNYGTADITLTSDIGNLTADTFKVGIQAAASDDSTGDTETDEDATDYPTIGLYSYYDFRAPNNMKELAMDGDSSTSWRGTQENKAGSWIEMDLNGHYLVSGINYQPEQTARNGTDCNGAFGTMAIEVSSDRIHYKRVYLGAPGWSLNRPSKVLNFEDGAEYARYIRIRGVTKIYFGEGVAEMSPILVNPTSESVPQVKGGTVRTYIKGTLAVGGTVYGEYKYFNSGAVSEGLSKYTFYTATTKDGYVKEVASGYTNGKFPEYTITEKDAGKYLQLAVVPVDKNGAEGKRTVTNFYKIPDKEKSAEIMTAVNALKTELDKMDLSAVTGAVTFPTLDNLSVNYKSGNPAYLRDNGALGAVSSTHVDVLPPAENGDSTTYYTATITLADGTTADYVFPVTLKAIASDVYASLDHGMVAADEDLTDEEKLAATHSGEPGNKIAVTSGTYGFWANYRYARVGSWGNNANSFAEAVSGGAVTAPTDKTADGNATSLWIGRMYVKAVPTATHSAFRFDEISADTDNPGYGYGYVTALHSTNAEISDNLYNLKSDEWTEVHIVSTLDGAKANSRKANIRFKGNYYPDYVYVDDFQVEPLKVGSVVIDGKTEIEIPDGDNAVTENYTSTVLNQFGSTLGMTETHLTEEMKVTYRLKEPVKGVSIDEKTGALTVTSEADTYSAVTIEALVGKSDAEKRTVTVTGGTAITGAVKPIGSGLVKGEFTVGLVNSNKTNIAMLEEQVNIGDTVSPLEFGLEVVESWQWYQSGAKLGAYTPISGATNLSLTVTDKMGGKYLKLVGKNSYGDEMASNEVYVIPSVDADQMFVYGNGVQKETLTVTAGEAVKGARTLVNNSGDTVKAMMIIGRYNSRGKLLDAVLSSEVEVAAGETVPIEATMNIPETITEGEYLNVFILSDTLKPFDRAVTLK